MLGKVKQFWIEGFLKPSLQGAAAVSLDLKARPELIVDLTQGIEALSVELDKSYEQLHETRIYKETGQGRTLLILGEPAAGKTIALLQLAQRLIERSEQNLSLPMPIVFNLSSWAKNLKPIFGWLIDELREKYQVPKSLSKPWIEQQQLILLLDGLDEVNKDHRNDCVRALNEFISLYPQTEVAVCKKDVLQWLSWLAKRMVQEKQTVFSIEKMQPTWLQNRREERAYRIRNFMIGGLTSGLIGGLTSGLIAGISKEISPLEQLNWSWQRAKSRLMCEFFTSFSCVLIDGLVFRLSGGLIRGLMLGLSGTEIEQRAVPNQGIRSSWRNCLIIGLGIGLSFGLVAGLIMGGVACIQHFTLRQMLHQKGCIPWNYARFLDFAS